MKESGDRVKTIRTTRDDVGHAYGIVIGMAATPAEALVELKRKAEDAVESLGLARELVDALEASGPSKPFEVVDVHFTAGVMEGGGSGWLAYGTLARK